MKRTFDVVFSCLCLLILFPIMLIVGIIIYLSDRGPVFYRQKRIGLNCCEFSLYKFRTMCVDAEKKGPYFTSAGDKRITSIGAFLRRTSIDELPQLLNVIAGDMSIVGPRPDVPQQRQNYAGSDWTRRHSVRPGVTGLAQATLRSSANEKQRLNLDIEYIENNSFLLDVKIIIMTVRQVFFKGGN